MLIMTSERCLECHQLVYMRLARKAVADENMINGDGCCPVCDAIFWPQDGKLMRASTTPQEDCSKCLQLQKKFKEGSQ